MSGYIHYSGGTDETGKKLAQGLQYHSGNKMPLLNAYDVYVGWGCRLPKGFSSGEMDSLVAQNSLRVLNHPSRVSENRNKLNTLKLLAGAEVPVPNFSERVPNQSWKKFAERIQTAVKEGQLAFPLLGLTKGHRGNPFFCFLPEDITTAIHTAEENESPLDYFRSFAPGVELRVHVIRNEIILIQEKVLGKDPVVACVESLKKKMSKEKKGFDVHAPTLEWAVKTLSKEMLQGADRLQRSTARGWELAEIDVGSVPVLIPEMAIEALEAVHLDLGAVSISVDGNFARVTNITTGPALQNLDVAKYVSAIQDFAGKKVTQRVAKESKKSASVKKDDKAKSELLGRVAQLLDGVSSSKAEKILKILQG